MHTFIVCTIYIEQLNTTLQIQIPYSKPRGSQHVAINLEDHANNVYSILLALIAANKFPLAPVAFGGRVDEAGGGSSAFAAEIDGIGGEGAGVTTGAGTSVVVLVVEVGVDVAGLGGLLVTVELDGSSSSMVDV